MTVAKEVVKVSYIQNLCFFLSLYLSLYIFYFSPYRVAFVLN